MQNNLADHKQDPEPVQDNVIGSQPGPEPGQVSHPGPNISCYIFAIQELLASELNVMSKFSKKSPH